MTKNRNVGIVEVRKHFNVSLPAVVNWCEKGLPYDEEFKGLKKVKRFNIAEVENWLIQYRER